jgi:hypothetical protein
VTVWLLGDRDTEKSPVAAACVMLKEAIVKSSFCLAVIVAVLAARSGFAATVKLTVKLKVLPPPPPPGSAEMYDGGVGANVQVQLIPPLPPVFMTNELLPPLAGNEVVVPEVFKLIGTRQLAKDLLV